MVTEKIVASTREKQESSLVTTSVFSIGLR